MNDHIAHAASSTLPLLVTTPEATVQLSPDGPTRIRVESSEPTDHPVSVTVSHPDLVTIEPSHVGFDEHGIAEFIVHGALAGTPDTGPVLLTFATEGQGPAFIEVFGPDATETTTLTLTDDTVPLAPTLFPAAKGTHLTFEPWAGDPYRPCHCSEKDHRPDPYDEKEPDDTPPGKSWNEPGYPPGPPGEPVALAQCVASFVNGVSPKKDCVPRGSLIRRSVSGNLKIVTFPGSRWTNPRGVAAQAAIIANAVAFYRRYCINLTPLNAAIPAAAARGMAAWYQGWFQKVTRAIGGPKKLGNVAVPTALQNEFVRAMRTLQTMAGNGLVVVFIDEYITDTSALVSANMQGFHQIGINFVDSASPKILSHELVHALGKRAPGTVGAVTWKHESGCRNAISNIARTNPRKPAPLAGMRYLDIAEFREIARNRAAGLLR